MWIYFFVSKVLFMKKVVVIWVFENLNNIKNGYGRVYVKVFFD